MSLIDRLLPLPVMSLAIIALWSVLAPSLSAGTVLLGALLGLVIPWLTKDFWPDRPRIARPLLAMTLGIRVFSDIIVANVQVARLVLGPTSRLRPAFVKVPLDIDHPFVATLLGSIVSLTPGTVSIEIDRQARELLVHALDVESEAVTIAAIKARYELPLKEIFRC